MSYGMDGWCRREESTMGQVGIEGQSTKDSIGRQEVLDAIDEIEKEVSDGEGFQYEKWRKYLCDLPSAQPEKRTENRAETHACDLISRAAAVDAVKDRYYKYGRSAKVEELAWAIEALPSAQPKSYREGYQAGFKDAQPEPCKDAVSRSRVKLLLARLRDAVDDGYGFNYQSAVDELRDMPPAQPERIRGRWGTTVASPTLIVCNRCGRTVLKNGSVHWNFCPTCGAEMEVSE